MNPDSNFLRFLLLGLSLFAGLFIGSIFSKTKHDEQLGQSGHEQEDKALVSTKSNRKTPLLITNATNHVWKQLGNLQDPTQFHEALTKLQHQPRSPLRSESFLDLHMEHSSYEDWIDLLKANEVTGTEIVSQLASHLGRVEPQKTMQLICQNQLRFSNTDELITFIKMVSREVARANHGEFALKELGNMPRGGSQQATSLFFSKEWARYKPAQAAQHFEELVYLRNMHGAETSVVLPYDSFADEIMASWVKKDIEGAEIFVARQSPGITKDSLLKALKKQQKAIAKANAEK